MGNDTLYGNAEVSGVESVTFRNFLEGGEGADVLVGSVASDVVSYRNSAAGVQVNLETGAAAGGEAEGDSLLDLDFIEHILGSAAGNALTGNGGENILVGGGGGDTITGGVGNDRLYGGAAPGFFKVLMPGVDGADVLSGGSGRDRLEGGAGSDTLTGGTGTDTFVFWGKGLGQDRITDFTVGRAGDRVDLSEKSGFDTFADVLAAMSDTEHGARLDLGSRAWILFEGVSKADFSAGHFLL